ncbi:uncharacterized protein KY384_003644 [Bacidia gigantensis]|uniref:uncharacterized protein n=1 Tax=Bacidia gigantensis TaxID=2732470 RepID=UPI001D04A685|nr:uncharacterized protein KY384_003644 [Bacidia gigantensis]KAG8532008.1 hypothetical protein KY384_003644 [Bacidia gigantensis]
MVRKRKARLLSSTRPKAIEQCPKLSSPGRRFVVKQHHLLRKQMRRAVTHGDIQTIDEIKAQSGADGALRSYQSASIQGQSAERGGDSSKILVEWFKGMEVSTSASAEAHGRLKLLEVGALRTDNACARSKIFDVERLDLHSQHRLIKKQDFMKRPIPTPNMLHEMGFDVVSLSLVLNFTEDAKERGTMLKRATSFLREPNDNASEYGATLPCLFLVLPAACVTNSRYLDSVQLEKIMQVLGYSKVREKISAKLVYYLWKYESIDVPATDIHKKREDAASALGTEFSVKQRTATIVGLMDGGLLALLGVLEGQNGNFGCQAKSALQKFPNYHQLDTTVDLIWYADFIVVAMAE